MPQRTEKPKKADESIPKLECWEWWVVGVTYPLALAAVVFLFDQLCWPRCLPRSEACAYVALLWLLLTPIIHKWTWQEIIEHKARRVDRSEVQSLFEEARTVDPRLRDPKRPEDYDEKERRLCEQVKRLQYIGYKGWTEYQVLVLSQSLIEFWKPDHLIEQARLQLAALAEYAQDSAVRYDEKLYDEWQTSVSKSIESLNEIRAKSSNTDASTEQEESGTNRKDATNEDHVAKEVKVDDAAEELRAKLRGLLDHVAGYRHDWTSGAALLRSLMFCSAISVIILLAMGLLPQLYDFKHGTLFFYNWAFLGTAGSLTAALFSLAKSDALEVGNTEGKQELWRTILGAILGFVSGILMWAMLAGGIVSSGKVVPKLESPSPENIGLSVFLAIGAGFYFERVFERVRSGESTAQ